MGRPIWILLINSIRKSVFLFFCFILPTTLFPLHRNFCCFFHSCQKKNIVFSFVYSNWREKFQFGVFLSFKSFSIDKKFRLVFFSRNSIFCCSIICLIIIFAYRINICLCHYHSNRFYIFHIYPFEFLIEHCIEISFLFIHCFNLLILTHSIDFILY